MGDATGTLVVMDKLLDRSCRYHLPKKAVCGCGMKKHKHTPSIFRRASYLFLTYNLLKIFGNFVIADK
jgi:hypothetical protein